MSSLYRTFAMLSLVVLALSGCGGGKSSSSTSTSATMAPTTEGQRETAALPTKAMAPIPAGLHCGATKPVWVNLKSKAYHEPTDPYYGRTRNGQYMCPSDAAAKGYHPAGAVHHHKRGAMGSGAGAPETAPT